MIMIMDTEKKMIDVVRKIELPKYYMDNTTKDEMKQLISFMKNEEGWIIHTYVPEKWNGEERYEIQLDVKTNKYKSITHKGQECVCAYLYNDKSKNAWMWRKYDNGK